MIGQHQRDLAFTTAVTSISDDGSKFVLEDGTPTSIEELNTTSGLRKILIKAANTLFGRHVALAR
jgi:hypothetical protein